MRLIDRMSGLFCPTSLTELGSGWDACSAICWYKKGVKEQHLVDIKPNLRVREVNAVLGYFGIQAISAISDLEQFGIHYHAPATLEDVPETQVTVSNSVLEHIPEGDLPTIVGSSEHAIHNIDYKDHYSNFDRSITPYNFLRYSSRSWKLFNPAAHYQNRLRHSDYVRLFESLGYSIECEVRQPENAAQLLKTVPINEEVLARYSFEELLPTGALFHLRRS